MKQFFQEIAKAVRDFKFYKEVKDFQVSRSVKYILSLILLITLVLTVRLSFDLARGLDIAIEWTRQNLPIIEIQDGIAHVDARQPFEIVEEDFALIIDTTGEVTTLDGYERGILLLKDRVLYKESDVKTETYSLSGIQSLRIDENFMRSLRRNAVWIAFPFLLIVHIIRFCISKFLHVTIFCAIAIAITAISNVKLDYKQLFNISIYAITASTILGTLLEFFRVTLPGFWIIYSGLCIVYLVMAVRNCKEPPAQTARAEDLSL
jgi:hypothetical protein